MSVCTRTGDDGTTAIYGGRRLSKSDPQVEALGSIDELSSFIGLVITKTANQQTKKILSQIQKDLYQIMSLFSTTLTTTARSYSSRHLETQVKKFEQMIDNFEKKLPKLNRFILPGGTEISSWFQILRVVCRRVERSVVRFDNNIIIVKYLNRLSDLLFVMARTYGKNKEIIL